MKRLVMVAFLLTPVLEACGGVNIGQGFAVETNITGAAVNVGAKTITQPKVVFTAQPQSPGFTVQSYLVDIQDPSGNRYESVGIDGRSERSASYVIKAGVVCPAGSAESCLPSSKIGAAVSTDVGTVELVSEVVKNAVIKDCAVSCPVLKMRVTFNGIDDTGRAQSVVVAAADLRINP
jgi:hypothetical protein